MPEQIQVAERNRLNAWKLKEKLPQNQILTDAEIIHTAFGKKREKRREALLALKKRFGSVQKAGIFQAERML